MPDFLPRSDASFRSWTANFADALPGVASRANLSPATIQGYRALQERFATLLAETGSNTGRSPSSIFDRNSTRAELERLTRNLAGQIRGSITNDPGALMLLGLRPRQSRRRHSRPSIAPTVTVAPTLRRSVRVCLIDQARPASQAKPDGVTFAKLWISSPRLHPSSSSAWTFCGLFTRTRFELQLPDEIQNGDPITFHACWSRTGAGDGPMSRPTSTRALFNPDKPLLGKANIRRLPELKRGASQAA